MVNLVYIKNCSKDFCKVVQSEIFIWLVLIDFQISNLSCASIDIALFKRSPNQLEKVHRESNLNIELELKENLDGKTELQSDLINSIAFLDYQSMRCFYYMVLIS